jgi:hypothetical protein
MGTQPCRKCGHEVSTSQDECPACFDKNPHGVPTPSPSPEPEPEPEPEPKTPEPEPTPSPPMT